MDIAKLNEIKKTVLEIPYPFETGDIDSTFAGIYLHGGSPFCASEHHAPIHSFRVFSKHIYPLFVLVPPQFQTGDLEELAFSYEFHVINIPVIDNVIEFNRFSIENLLLLPELSRFENLLYFQSDGFLIKGGWEDHVINYDWIGAPWRSSIGVIENTFCFKPIRIGNGGFNFRKRSKCLEVLELVNKMGGQNKIVKGITINNKIANAGSFLQEDLFFSYFGFGSKIFQSVSIDEARKFSIEPITFKEFQNRDSYGFHRIDE